ncbi:MAG: proton-conducting transporter membrane subunit [Candidatus Aminicenantes bacterium]|nr:proton-conducting transporter membrane subunit [Candidatus Aminicenantes bacterium]
MAEPLVLLVAVPLAIGLVNIFLPVVLRKALVFLGLVFGCYLVAQLYGALPDGVGLFGATILGLDKLGFLMLVFAQGLSLIIFIFCLKGVDREIEKPFHVLYPLTVSFVNGTLLSVNGVGFLVFWGFSGLTLYGFALLGRGKEAPGTAKKTFILIGGSDAFLLLGLALVSLRGGWTLGGSSIPLVGPAAWLAFVFLLVAALAKAGGFPFHTWVPDYARDAPVESAALLPASLDKLLGIYLLTRIMIDYFDTGLAAKLTVVTLGALTVITAVMMAMVQHNGRRLLGYHAVSQVGYMIMGVGSGAPLALAGGLFHLLNHTLYKSNLFLSLGSVEKRAGTNELNDLGGLARAMPVTFVMALIGALSISGIPPFNGFFSKWMIYQGLLEQASGFAPGYAIWLLVCLVLAVFGSALTLASFMKFLHAVFLGQRPDRLAAVKEAPLNQWLATGGLALFCVVFGLFARELPLRLLIQPAVAESGFEAGAELGLYSPRLILFLFAIGFGVGFIVYLLTKKVRYDEVYLGGQANEAAFRVSGVGFYKEILELRPLRGIYNLAQKKWFDVYDLGGKATLGLSHLFQKVHAGLLPIYMLFIVFGLLAFMLMVL